METTHDQSGFPRPFGKYELLEHIGTGGMAEVFRARLPGVAGFEKIVCVKRLLPHLSDDPRIVQMFVDEAKLAARVQHKNVVQVFELNKVEDGEFYIAMEYVAGTDLKRLLRHLQRAQRRLPPWFSVHAITEVLDALAYAHDLVDDSGRRRNIVHRDVSPENVFVSHLGDIKLGDFGVARDDTRGLVSDVREVKGKISYMAPEQLEGNQLDQRCDVFAAAVVLWECLTQRRLFSGESAGDTIRMITRAPRLPPSHFVTDVPPELDACVLEALQPEPDRRTPSTREFQDHLLSVLSRMRPTVGPIDIRSEMRALLAGAEHGATTTRDGHDRRDARRLDVGMRSDPRRTTLERCNDASPTWADESSIDIVLDLSVPENAEDWDAIEPAPPIPAIEPEPLPDPPAAARPIILSPPIALPSTNAQAPPQASSGPPADETRYAIIHPRLRSHVTSEDETEEIDTRDFVQRAVFYEVPMPGTPSAVETADIVARRTSRNARPLSREDARRIGRDGVGAASPGRSPSEQPRMTDWGRLAPEISASSARIWEPYRGAYPIWLRSKEKLEFGPCSLRDVLLTLRSKIPRLSKRMLELSGDRRGWMPLQDFLRYARLDLLSDESDLMSEESTRGSLDLSSLIATLGIIAERKPTGRLVVLHPSSERLDRVEIHVVRGAPTHVATNAPEHETPALLVEHRIVDAERIEEVMHSTLLEAKSLHRVVAERIGGDLETRWPKLMAQRLEQIFEWQQGACTFLGTAPIHTSPFARTPLSLLPEAIRHSRSFASLRTALSDCLERSFVRAGHFERIVEELELPPRERAAASAFGSMQTLEHAIRACGDEKIGSLLALLFLELGAIRPAPALVVR